MTSTYGYSHFIHFKTVATEVEIQILSTQIIFPYLLPQFGSDLFSSKEGGVPVLLSIYWMYKSLVFGDEFLAQGLHLKSHQRCSAAFCRPVKFFHTDWIIISLWFLPYTQRHCHVRIEKHPVQTVAIKLEAHNSLEYHYMEITKVVKPSIRRGWPNTFGNVVYVSAVTSLG